MMKFGLIAAATLAAVAMPAMAQTVVTRTTEVHHNTVVHTSPLHRKRKICSTHWGPHHHKITRCYWR